MNWEAHALVPAGVGSERASTDENNADEFWFCRIPICHACAILRMPFNRFPNLHQPLEKGIT